MPPEQNVKLRQAEQALAARDYRRLHTLCTEVLQRNPRSAQALFLLALLAAEHQNHAKAVEVLDRALSLAPDRADYHAQKGRCLLALSRPREALEAARLGMQARVDGAWTWDTLGVVLTRAGAHAEAVPAFRRAVELEPGKPAYFYNLGAALQFIGEFGDAETAYRSALALDPEQPRVWSALAQLRKAPFSEAEVEWLRQRIAQSTTDADAQLHWCHALAKQREDQGNQSEAWGLLGLGKAAKRASLDYRFADDARLFERVTEVCTRPFCEAGGGHASDEPIFIVGMPRTGTTLVERILSSHPQVYAAGELSHFSLALKRVSRTHGARVLDADTLAAAADVDLAEVGRMYLDSTRPRTGHTPRFIDKMPLNFFYAGIIRRALPGARILCLKRHPLDAIVSNYRQLFATGFAYYNYAYDLLDTARYWQAFDGLCRHWSQTLGEAWLEVRYEQVVDDLEAQARRILAHCGLPWDPTVLEFHRNQAPVATASSVQVRQPLYRSSVARWRRLEAELAPVIEMLGADADLG
ncbi:MAG: sulfotransferase [Lysobacterales bacterium]|nr:sulfotransferase [Rhodanobacteraceae bacterium]